MIVKYKIKEGRRKDVKISVESFRLLEGNTRKYNKKYLSKDKNNNLH